MPGNEDMTRAVEAALAGIPCVRADDAPAARAALYAFESHPAPGRDHELACAAGHAMHLVGGPTAWADVCPAARAGIERIVGGLDWLSRAELAQPLWDIALAAAAATRGLPASESVALQLAWASTGPPVVPDAA